MSNQRCKATHVAPIFHPEGFTAPTPDAAQR